MRGEYYLWTSSGTTPDQRALHIWSADGYDSWDRSGWACNDDGTRREGMELASGTSLPMRVADEFVIMRLVEIIHEGLVDAAIDRALESGRPLLEKNADRLRSALGRIGLEEPDPI